MHTTAVGVNIVMTLCIFLSFLLTVHIFKKNKVDPTIKSTLFKVAVRVFFLYCVKYN